MWKFVAIAPCAGSGGPWWGCHALSDLVKAQRAAHSQIRSDLLPITQHDYRKNPAGLSQSSWLITSACTLTQRLVKIQHLQLMWCFQMLPRAFWTMHAAMHQCGSSLS